MLQLVLGRAGCGKTEYVFSHIKEAVDGGKNNIVLITPEQYSFIAERRLLELLGEKNVGCVENLSFSRLNDEIRRRYGGNDLPVLSKGAKAVLMKKAIEAVSDSLKLYGKNAFSTDFVNNAVRIYDEMKSCRVSCDDILRAADNTDKEILSKKLYDISSIIGAYDALISGEFYDPACELTRLYETLNQLDYFSGKTVFIDGFSGFVAQEYKIIEVILSQSDAVYITLCTDSYLNSDRYDLFSYVNSNIRILKDITKKAGERFLNPIMLTENHRAKSEALAAAQKNIFSNTSDTYKNDGSINIYAAKNISDECDWISAQICTLLRDGYKAKDIAVICRDLDKYKKELEFSFSKFNVPFFNDERQAVNTQPAVLFVCFLLRVMIYSYRSDDIFSMLKTGLCEIDEDKISQLENYVFVWNINGSKWNSEFTQSTKGFTEEITDSDRKKLDEINESREYIIQRLNKFKRRCKGKSCRDICAAVYDALIDFGADKRLKSLAIELDKNGKSALAKEQGRIWDLLMETLNSLAEISDDRKITFSEFYDLFSLMVNCEDLGTVPSGLDNVQIGCADRIRCDNPRVVFIAGANEGEFPAAVTSAGLLSESDRIALIADDFKLYSYGETLNAQEKYFAYMAVCDPSEKLFVSFRRGNTKHCESAVVTSLKRIFPDIEYQTPDEKINIDMLQSRENAFQVVCSHFNENDVTENSLKEYFKRNKEYSSKLKAVMRLTDNEVIEIKNKNLSLSLFGNDMYVSASRIEDYYNCSFRYFCKFGIGARPLRRAEMDPMQTGTVIHFVLESIIKENPGGFSMLTDAQISTAVNKYLLYFLNNKMGDSQLFGKRFKYQFMRLSKMICCVVSRLRDEFLQSDFQAKAFELEIGEGKPVSPKIISLPDGGTVGIRGAVDRVDTFEQNGVQYVRVVDYKSGNKTFQLSDVVNGLNLQMFVYLFTICEDKGEYSGIPAGVLYMHSARSVLNIARSADDSEVKSKENSDFKMKGLVLSDDENEVVSHMEHELKGKYIPAKISSKGDLTGSIATLAQMGHLSDKINNLIENMGTSLHNGEICQNPVFGKNHQYTCDFCDYSDVCCNRLEIQQRTLEELSDAQVFEQIKAEEE